MTKIALIQAPGWGRDCPPYAMALLSAIVRRAGYAAHCFDLNNNLYYSSPQKLRKYWDDKDLYSFWSDRGSMEVFCQENERMIDFQVKKILNSGARIAGFTVHFTSVLFSLEVARRIKAADKDKIIVFGGPHCSRQLMGLDLIKEDAVDIVITGEGDLIVIELIKQVEQKGRVDFVKGALIKKDGNLIDCGECDIEADLDNLPFPDYADFRDDMASGLYQDPARLEILDSRGCINRCHFCSEWQLWRSFRSMGGKRIFDEIAFQMRLFPWVNHFYFIGSLLNGNAESLSDFCDEVIRIGIKISWSGQAIVSPKMSKSLLEKMKKAGCVWLGYGIESGSQEMLDRMHKKLSLDVAEQVLRDTHDAGIMVQANFMFGLPTETRSDSQQTLQFLKRNRQNIDSVLASQSFCVIDKGTYIYDHPKEFGLVDREHHLFWEGADGNTYPERFRRYEEFCGLALSLGLPETSGVLRQKPDKQQLLNDYSVYRHGGLAVAELDYQALGGAQRKVVDALNKRGLSGKIDNYLLIEEQKAERREHLDGFPYWLTIDPASMCNLKCPFCPTGQGRNSRTKTMLSFDQFKLIMDQLGRYLIHIDFCNWGEPLLNKDIYKMIKLAKRYGINTKIDSNFTVLGDGDIDRLLDSGVDKVKVSIDGVTPETYAKYRVGGSYDAAMSNLSRLLDRKRQLCRTYPKVEWQFLVFRHNEHEIDSVRKLAAEIGVDKLGVTKAFIGDKSWMPTLSEYSNYNLEKLRDEATRFEETSDCFKVNNSLCDWPWEALVINSNGSVSPCCSVEDEKDDFGNIFDSGVSKIWNSPDFISARGLIKGKGTAEMLATGNVCRGCKHAGLTNIDLLSCDTLFDALCSGHDGKLAVTQGEVG
jgi:radical SAM superfamily enzyme YgiQ (UPF0313 family)/MoaA/NifB/PqqE/SkfB family radical SAM enzyme